MTEQYIGWALVVGLAIGGALVWFAVGRVPRSSEDISVEERAAEAGWIGETMRTRGVDMPEDVIEDVLRLHAAYLEGEPMDTPRERVDDSRETFDDTPESLDDSPEPFDFSRERLDSAREE